MSRYGDGAPIITETIFSEAAVEGTTDKFESCCKLKHTHYSGCKFEQQ